MSKAAKKKQPATCAPPYVATKKDTDPDWTHNCENCGSSPVVPITGMCGPCTFGEAETAGGNW